MTNNGDRLERIEALVHANAEAIAAMRDAQEHDRFDLSEARQIADSNARAIAAGAEETRQLRQSLQASIQETQHIADSNARAIAAGAEETRQLRQSLQASIQETQHIADSNARAIAAGAEETRQLRQNLRELSEESRQRLNENIADTVSMISDLGQQQAETDQRFNTLLAEARADRLRQRAAEERNRIEHEEFRVFMQDTLREIRQIWQRLAG
ncbi:hypothetical protein XM38_048640 [Halomicronema hongdechloris C2206]|uniref:Uncharacterized protein n=1 Tax=Halomicronema hongdechloris C2206 TaxID=1641165 RepID=A0A1Z3HU93_9CYAN|nr:hypothetical protein [Halomicronema hongdechloris]ASC73890.1 hypothetical protein XM38_048640 [Halomicronema hongdechloris C2206]